MNLLRFINSCNFRYPSSRILVPTGHWSLSSRPPSKVQPMWSPHRRWYLWLIKHFLYSSAFILLSAWISETTSTLFMSHDCLYCHQLTFALFILFIVLLSLICTVVSSSALFYILPNDDEVYMSYDWTARSVCLGGDCQTRLTRLDFEFVRQNVVHLFTHLSIPTNSLYDDDMAGLQFSRIRRRTGTNARTPRNPSPVLRSTLGRQTTEPHNGYPETSQD